MKNSPAPTSAADWNARDSDPDEHGKSFQKRCCKKEHFGSTMYVLLPAISVYEGVLVLRFSRVANQKWEASVLLVYQSICR
jgi:hypothetical protein